MSYNLAKIGEMAYTSLQTYNEIIGDQVDALWADASAEIRAFYPMIADFYLRNPEADQKYSHELYLILKKLNGWSYGDTYDDTNKKSPMIIPYQDLNAARKVKYKIVKNVIVGNIEG